MYKKLGDPILHIELRKWADVMLIAPCTMNTLTKLAIGLCDNLLTNTARAWDYEKPMLIAPACNTVMWGSPLTREQIIKLENIGARFISPTHKSLACGDTGIGAMAEIKDIVNIIKHNIRPALMKWTSFAQ